MTGHVAPRQATSSPAAITARAPSRTAQRQGKAAIVTCPARLTPATPGAPPPAPPRTPPRPNPGGGVGSPRHPAPAHPITVPPHRLAIPPPGQPATWSPPRRVQHGGVEAGSVAGMAGPADLVYLDQHRVPVAVEGDRLHAPQVARGLPFHPLPPPPPRPIGAPPGGEGP